MNLRQFKSEFDPILREFLEKKLAIIHELHPDKLTDTICWHLLTYSLGWGKRFRPYFVYLGYKLFSGKNDEAIIRFSLFAELIQLFALIHDDIIDDGITRHSVDTYHVFASWLFASEKNDRLGASQAILAGDFLLSWAYEILLRSGHLFPTENYAKATENITIMLDEVITGQIIDVNLSATPDADPEIVKRKNALKTASYSFVRPFLTGALLAGISDVEKEKCVQMCLLLWEAFQVRDDLYDIMRTESDKTPFSDVQEGQKTFLTSHVFSFGTEEQKNMLRNALWKKLTQEQIEELSLVFEDSGAVEAAKAHIESVLNEAEMIQSSISWKNEEFIQHFSYIFAYIRK